MDNLARARSRGVTIVYVCLVDKGTLVDKGDGDDSAWEEALNNTVMVGETIVQCNENWSAALRAETTARVFQIPGITEIIR